jgi:pyruvate,water dikinase
MYERQLTNHVVSSVIAKEGLCLHFENAVVEPPWDVPSGVQIRQADLSVSGLFDSHNFDLNNVGTKAHQISRVQAYYNQSIMTGTFAIPFYYYHAHVSKLSNVDNLQPKEIQQFIASQDVAEEVISSVIQRIKDNKWSAVIFRGSTNCEDLEQFNGAGLYDSVPLSGDELADRTKVQQAIEQVWASAWNHRAVRERDFYKIPHKDVNIAILVQPYLDNKMNGSLANVLINGVCITHDVGYHKVKHVFYVNW